MSRKIKFNLYLIDYDYNQSGQKIKKLNINRIHNNIFNINI